MNMQRCLGRLSNKSRQNGGALGGWVKRIVTESFNECICTSWPGDENKKMYSHGLKINFSRNSLNEETKTPKISIALQEETKNFTPYPRD